MEEIRIAAGIVLYNPDLERLAQNIEAIRPQVNELFVVDNDSENWSAIQSLLSGCGISHFLHHEQNLGIAEALNQLMQMAMDCGFDWLLTLDQDSVCPPDLISAMRPFTLSESHAGILCPVIQDRSFGIEHTPSSTEPYTEVQECITSASLTRISAWQQAGGFDARLFIDAVDTDFCLTLREHGCQILRINQTTMLHEIGHQATCHKVFGKTYIAFNHTPIRYYYMARNMVFLSLKHPGFLSPAPWRCMLTMMARILVILLWERQQKLEKCRQIVRGIHAGIHFE